MKKYELVKEDFIIVDGVKLYRIKALIDFVTISSKQIKAGDLGGYIESENNLSQDGLCWVYDEAKVYDEAWVSDDAEVYGKAKVYGIEFINDIKIF